MSGTHTEEGTPREISSEAPETRQPCHHRRAAQGVPGAQSGASSPSSLAPKASSRHAESAVRTQAPETTEVAVPREILLLPKFGGTSAQPERNKQDFPHPQRRAWPLPSPVSRGKPRLPGKTDTVPSRGPRVAARFGDVPGPATCLRTCSGAPSGTGSPLWSVRAGLARVGLPAVLAAHAHRQRGRGSSLSIFGTMW